MPFTAHDLRYRAEETYPVLYAHLSRQAQRILGSLKYDAFELDVVVGHVIEQLVRLGLLGGGDRTPLTALDRLSTPQFYAFLNRSIKNKAIDRLRKRRIPVNSSAELEAVEGENEDDPLDDAVESIWGTHPFANPEEITLHIASQQELRNVLVHCIKALEVAPKQLQAIIQELEEYDATELLQDVVDELKTSLPESDLSIAHISQHKDHAHKKLRHCLQEKSSNLTVAIALRLTEYGVHDTSSQDFVVDIQTLARNGLTQRDVRAGLQQLTAEGFLDWQGEEIVHMTSSQVKRLTRFYRTE